MPRKPSRPDLQPGARFGLLTISGSLITSRKPSGHGYSYSYPCRCDCGREKVVRHSLLLRRNSRSCGCQRGVKPADGIKGPVRNRLRGIWALMLRRCENPEDRSYARYGGRGITVAPEFQVFSQFLGWAIAAGYASGLTLDRRDNDGPYSLSNCRFVSRAEQAKNRRDNVRLTAFGETKTVTEWERDPRCQVNWTTIRYRLRRGWNPERAIGGPRRIESGRKPRRGREISSTCA